MDVTFRLSGQTFEWDSEKAASNLRKHGVPFQEACEVFFDPFFLLMDAGVEEESRQPAVGYSEGSRCLFVVHVVRKEEAIRIISARPATAQERNSYEHE